MQVEKGNLRFERFGQAAKVWNDQLNEILRNYGLKQIRVYM